jgi:predicted transcriptional regulator
MPSGCWTAPEGARARRMSATYPRYPASSVLRKTSVYLGDRRRRRLARLARQEKTSQGEIIRRVIATYVPEPAVDRQFAGAGVAEGPNGSVADIPDEELLRGFGGE